MTVNGHFQRQDPQFQMVALQLPSTLDRSAIFFPLTWSLLRMLPVRYQPQLSIASEHFVEHEVTASRGL